MTAKQRCQRCSDNEGIGHNYCRRCGYYFKKAVVNNARVAVAYDVKDRHCGYCGEEREKCSCR